MSNERITQLITAKGDVLKRYKDDRDAMPTIGTVFKEINGIEVIGGDHVYCVRVSIPADQLEILQASAREEGYITEADYTLHTGAVPGKSGRRPFPGASF
jgi:hypothetical protein